MPIFGANFMWADLRIAIEGAKFRRQSLLRPKYSAKLDSFENKSIYLNLQKWKDF